MRMLTYSVDTMNIKAQTIATLRQFDIGNKFAHLALPKAAVLIPLFVKGEELYTVMTLRSKELRTNAGEVCFPGGKRDPIDIDDVETALREAQEEIGLPHQVEVVCKLAPVFNKSGLIVTPVVGFIDQNFTASPNPAEVSAVFTVPLDLFTQEKNHSEFQGISGVVGPLHFFNYMDPISNTQYQIWGLTAWLAMLVAVCALQKKTEFEVGIDFKDALHVFEQNLLKVSKL
ncbi:peroxisomal coenzyme A diphosphatase NUDT7 isoform X2 [Boleophthalmus pectinirostris]|uniref:peroxisomal coenzyme A diphosphatase NUDT7 isoform X2 n=1 Tax=Boleophthalmus pectinirostris TaxID=150288 RepID=UPI00242BDF1B|nr:peroxisomal coenzyme A diphosphatase NUDT7 isoform X2 [Boleophthalmus pectinirostris]